MRGRACGSPPGRAHSARSRRATCARAARRFGGTSATGCRCAAWRSRTIPLALAGGARRHRRAARWCIATDTTSVRAWAAELAVDHVKCFMMNAVLGTHQSTPRPSRSLASAFAWDADLPDQPEVAEASSSWARDRVCTAREESRTSCTDARAGRCRSSCCRARSVPKTWSRRWGIRKRSGRRTAGRSCSYRGTARRCSANRVVRSRRLAVIDSARRGSRRCSRDGRCAAVAALGLSWTVLTTEMPWLASDTRVAAPEGAACPVDAKRANLDFRAEGHQRQHRDTLRLQGQGHPARLLGDLVRPLQGRDSVVHRVPEQVRRGRASGDRRVGRRSGREAAAVSSRR